MKLVTVCAACAAIVLAGCAAKPENIQASYVSPLTYQNYSCNQLAEEAQRVSGRASQAVGIQKKAATRDAVATGVAVVVFWPALFFVKGGGTNEAEVAKLKGEMQTIERVSTQKKCGLNFQKS
ncbi:MAG: hypothetical protein AAGI12_08250 [Pseudomonadota bacterium]